ncbi:hypothetical protein PVK06_008650 [Gossypium arboreum]|uniref:Uncharacterized protein n=1 Tax=Gossypium arboreum TaxID=29729 RepID=A0ABR0QKT6_GOSAR|nr:hypothetical protein PVK06_008650 [Gossypium arboreum]
MEQIEATSLISLKLQRSRLKTANLIFLTLQWNRLNLQIMANLILLSCSGPDLSHQPYLPEVAVEQVKITNSYHLEVPAEVDRSYKSVFHEITLERIEAPILKPLKIEWIEMRLLEEEEKKYRDSVRPGKIGPFIVFAPFSLHDNEQRGAAVIGQFWPRPEKNKTK